jgi:hypothetical protein
MASRKSKANSAAPDPNRIQTRAKNASTHPGRVVNEVLAAWRKPEEIEDEKRVRTERRQARKRKEADLHTAVQEVAEYENQMAVDDTENKTRFPRRKPMGELLLNKMFECYKVN